MTYDVTVVGAGPTGGFCAYLLAKAGLSVLIIEKTRFPRSKLCGGGVSQRAAHMLRDVVDLSSIPSRRVTGSYLSYRNEHLTFVGQQNYSYSVNRTEFDASILDAAIRAGCEVLMPAEVSQVIETPRNVTASTRDGRSFCSNFLVFAEGINGRLHQQVGYTGRREVTMALEIDVVPRYVPVGLKENTLLDFGAIPGGYAWIFPKEGFLNIGAYWHRSSAIDQAQQFALERFLSQFDWARDCGMSRLRGFPLPYRIDYPVFNTSRTLLIGDAAGAVEDFYGEGFFYGLSSSMVASQALEDAIRRNRPLKTYTKRLKSDILSQVRVSRLLAQMFYSRQRFGYYRMVRNKLMNSAYANLIHGALTERSLLFNTIVYLPLSVFAGSLKDSEFNEVGMVGNVAS